MSLMWKCVSLNLPGVPSKVRSSGCLRCMWESCHSTLCQTGCAIHCDKIISGLHVNIEQREQLLESFVSLRYKLWGKRLSTRLDPVNNDGYPFQTTRRFENEHAFIVRCKDIMGRCGALVTRTTLLQSSTRMLLGPRLSRNPQLSIEVLESKMAILLHMNHTLYIYFAFLRATVLLRSSHGFLCLKMATAHAQCNKPHVRSTIMVSIEMPRMLDNA